MGWQTRRLFYGQKLTNAECHKVGEMDVLVSVCVCIRRMWLAELHLSHRSVRARTRARAYTHTHYATTADNKQHHSHMHILAHFVRIIGGIGRPCWCERRQLFDEAAAFCSVMWCVHLHQQHRKTNHRWALHHGQKQKQCVGDTN